jgi:hypothetical protein
MKVFISYSTKDMHIVEEFKKLVEAKGIEAYVAAKDVQPGGVLSDKLVKNIKTSNCLVAIMTKDGVMSGTLQNELGVAKASKIRIVPLVEEGVDPKGVLSGIEQLRFDKDHPDQALKDAAIYLSKLKKQADADFIGILILAGLTILVLMSGSNK